jgi:hypothetical protein
MSPRTSALAAAAARVALGLVALAAGGCAASSEPSFRPAPPPASPGGSGAAAAPVLDLAGRTRPPGPDPGPRGVMPGAPSAGDAAVAIVDGNPVYASEVARFLFRYAPESALEALGQILDARILEADAVAEGVTLPAGEIEARTEEEMRRRATELRVQYGPEMTLDAYLRDRFGTTTEAFRSGVEGLVRLRALRDRLLRLEALREDRIRLRVLVLDTEEAARDAARRLEEGADFASLARQVSRAPATDLPSYPRGEVEPPELADMLFALPDGGVSPPVRVAREGREAFQVFKVLEVRRGRPAIWAADAASIEAGLRERPVLPAEYLQWARAARGRHGVRFLLEEPAAGAAGAAGAGQDGSSDR